MIPLFLKAKHWQLFLLTFGIIFVAEIVMFSFMFSSMSSTIAQGVPPDPLKLLEPIKYLLFFIAFSLSVTVGWNWSIGMGLQKFIPDLLRPKTVMFRISILFPLIYGVAFVCFVIVLMTQILDIATREQNPEKMLEWIWVFPLLIPFHLFAMFSTFYTIYFIAMTFKTAELQRAVTFNDYMAEFFLVWFFPIGVWILQPKINKMVAGREEEGTFTN